jgi:hypothetical protein
MRSEIVGSSGERPTVNEAVGGFSVFLATGISHSICASQVSNYVVPLCDLVCRIITIIEEIFSDTFFCTYFRTFKALETKPSSSTNWGSSKQSSS